MDRVEKAHQEAREKLDAFLADPDMMEFGGADLKIFIDEKKKVMLDFENELKWAGVKGGLEDDKGFVERKMKYAKDQGLRFMDRVEQAHGEVGKRLDAMAENEGYIEYDSALQVELYSFFLFFLSLLFF